MSIAINRRSHLINPDTRPVLVVAAGLTTLLGAVSFLGSAAGLMGVAPTALREAGQSWAVPVAIDGAIVVYTLAILVKRRRAERAPFAWVALLAFTAFSSVVNALHAWETSGQGTEGLLEACVAAILPLATFAATHTLADLIVDPEPSEAAALEPLEWLEEPIRVERPVPLEEPALEAYDDIVEPEVAEPVAAPVVARGRRLPRAERERRDAEVRRLADEEGLGPRAIEARLGVPKSTAARALNAR